MISGLEREAKARFSEGGEYMNKFLGAALAAAVCVLGTSGTAWAAYPEKPINVVVAYAPGGTGDITVRMLAKPLEKILGQPLVIINKSGGAGVPGLNYVLNAKPDGYTIAGGGPSASFSAAFFLKTEPFDMDNMVFVAGYTFLDRILLAKKDKPYQTWEEFVAYAKAHPGKISVGSGASQESMEVLRAVALMEGLDLNFVMYKSGGEASADLLGGHVDLCELGVGTAGYHAARKGDLNLLVNLGSGEIPGFPDVARLTDLGYPFHTTILYGFVLPKGTPDEIRAVWESAIEQALQDPELQAAMDKSGFKPQFLNSQTYERYSREGVASIPAMIEYIQKVGQ